MRIFGHHVSRTSLVLATVEALVLYVALYLAVILHTDVQPAFLMFNREVLATMAVAIVAMMLMGLYDSNHLVDSDGPIKIVLRLAFGLLLAFGVVLAYHAVAPAPLLQNTTLAIGLTLAFFGLLVGRSFYRRLATSPALKRRLLVLGTGARAQGTENIHADRQPDELPYKVVAYVATNPEAAVEVPPERLIQLAPNETLLGLARKLRAEEIVVAVRDRRGTLPIRQLLECKLHGIPVTDVSSFFERECQQLRLDSLNTSWLVFGDGFRQNWARNVIKRSLDLIASTVLLLLTFPVMLATALAIRLDSPGPIFYWQTRVGMGNRPFDVCKFRSMRQDAESNGVAQWANGNDDRVTRVGRVIRKFRIDELPQIINVFKGEMSFVGPRPERPVFVDQLSEQIPYFLARHSIRPGITGWAQVRYPYGASVHDAREKLQYDLYYLKNHTLFMDIVIIIETVTVVLFGRGAR